MHSLQADGKDFSMVGKVLGWVIPDMLRHGMSVAWNHAWWIGDLALACAVRKWPEEVLVCHHFLNQIDWLGSTLYFIPLYFSSVSYSQFINLTHE